MNDFKAEPEELREAMVSGVRRVLESGRYILGTEVETFESRWAALCGTRNAIGVGNGMDAIEIALRSLGIGRGHEVIAPAMTAFATVLAIMRAGAIPVLADIDPDTALLSPQSAARCVSARTKAIVVVHLYGQIRDMEDWVTFCASRGIALVEDCAQAHLAQWQGRGAGSFGRLGAYSFYPTKNLGAAGDAGMIVCDDDALADAAARLRDYGQGERFVHDVEGLNSRLDEVQAAILGARLEWLPRFNERRSEIATAYRASISNPAVTLLDPPADPANHANHLFVVRCEDRAALRSHLKARGVESAAHYPLPIHHQQPCGDLRRDPGGLEASERHAATCLSLPCHAQLRDLEVDRVLEAINAFAR